MNDEQNGSITFNMPIYGALLKNARLKHGFRRAEDFIAEIERKTGYVVSRDVYYRLEKGAREPEISLYFAINLTLYGRHHFPKSDEFRFADNELWARMEERSDFYTKRQIAESPDDKQNPGDLEYYSDITLDDDTQYKEDRKSSPDRW